MTLNQVFGKNLRFLRYAAGVAVRGNGFTQQEIAKFLGVSRKTVVFWESGQVPSRAKLAFVCEFFTRRLELEEPLSPQDLLEKNLEDEFLVIPERAEVRRVPPEQKRMLGSIFARAAELDPDDLQKILDIIDSLIENGG